MGFRTRLLYSYIIARSIAFLVRLSRYHLWCFTCYLDAVRPDGILTESMVDKISRKLGFKKAPYIPESQVLTERFEAYKRKQEEKQG